MLEGSVGGEYWSAVESNFRVEKWATCHPFSKARPYFRKYQEHKLSVISLLVLRAGYGI